MKDALRRGRQAIQAALQKYSPNAVFAGFSGGDDSLVASHFLHEQMPVEAKTLFVDTGIGFQTTRCFVRDICEERGWGLHTYHAEEDAGQSFDEIVRGNEKLPGGFPGPAAHEPGGEFGSYIYDRLKGRCIQEMHRDWKAEYGGKVLLISGIRKDESERRMGYDDSVIDKDPAFPGVIWVNPIYYVSAAQRDRYIQKHALRRNPASKLIGSSGECLCMANDEHGQRMRQLYHHCLLLTKHSPYDVNEMELWGRLVDLWWEVKDQYPWTPDMRPPEWFKNAQGGQLALETGKEAEKHNTAARTWNPMCVGCGKANS